MYLTWITVSRDSMGQFALYKLWNMLRAHDDILTSRA